MTQTTVPPVRQRVRALAFVVAGIAAMGLAFACAQTRRSPGEECIKSEDCLSGVCVQLVCGSTGPLTDTMENNPEAGETEAGTDASDAASAADTFTAPDTGSSSGSDAGEAGEASSGD
jgi:hypothetical protein